jgi:uncharacterized tellurite resistance protein B-like protein
MIRALAEFFSGRRARPDFAPDDHRVAAAALLIRVGASDGVVGKAEDTKIGQVLTRGFGLDPRMAAAVVAEATRREREASDLSDFTTVLRRALSQQGLERIVELLWELSYADGTPHEFEENIVHRVADLLGVADADRFRARTASEENET